MKNWNKAMVAALAAVLAVPAAAQWSTSKKGSSTAKNAASPPAAAAPAPVAENPATSQPDAKPVATTMVAKAAEVPEVRPAAGAASPDYLIGAQDVINVNVWKEPELSMLVPVRPDGNISLPLIHDVRAQGQTPMQLAAHITARLKQYLAEPRVTVIVSQINSRRFYVLGEVARPGAFPLLPNMTVLQALSTAGGIRDFANPSKIYVLRTDNGAARKFPFNYKDVISGKRVEQDIELKPSDTVVVP
ncbi:MAG: polysaccharide biosynthesis/export family protein [Acidobacteria bacterium]|nr:polysaccharide biosynthesis/export family protein [Acidobacteriota bacterium]